MTEQHDKSLSDLEADIAKSRERLAATIDELAFRAQPKNIVAEQKRQLRSTMMDKYHSFMGTTPAGTTEPSSAYDSSAPRPSAKEQAQAKVEEIKAQAQAKADEVRAQAQAKADEVRQQAQAKADEMRQQAQAKVEGVKASHGGDTSGATASGTATYATTTTTESSSDGSPLAELKTRAQVKADQARLKLDEATHDADGELRADRVATGLAVLGAALVSLGVAKRNRG